MLKWSVKLSEYEINYKPRTTLKGQVLADFVVEFIEGVVEFGQPSSDKECARPQHETWYLLCGRCVLSQRRELGIHLEAPFGNINKSVALSFEASNNEAEYEALLHRLEATQLLEAQKIKVYSNSKLVVYQTLAQYEAKDERMKAYLDRVLEMSQNLDKFHIE